MKPSRLFYRLTEPEPQVHLCEISGNFKAYPTNEQHGA